MGKAARSAGKSAQQSADQTRVSPAGLVTDVMLQQPIRSGEAPKGIQMKRAQRLAHQVQRLPDVDSVQAKLTLGPADDVYEREADQVASQVMAGLGKASVGSDSAGGDSTVGDSAQREVQDDDLLQTMPEDDDLLQTMPEDDDLLQTMPEDDDLLQTMPEDDDLLQTMADPAAIRRSAGGEGGSISSDTETSIESSRGSGKNIDGSVLGNMEQAFDADFGGVKVHTDSKADTLNRQLNAKAFTTGQDIFFRQGEYSPNSSGGQELLAHELTHVVQQTGPGDRGGDR